jgi:diguanylate cyclase (GGDEF)-like protein
LWSLASAVCKQDRSLIRTQLEKEDLATELAQALERAEYLATRDSLTGLYNRRAFEQVAHSLRAASDGATMSLILIDLDHFKAINDQYGHACGDSVLQKSAAAILETMRPVDVLGRGDSAVARWGGEEFLLLLPDCSLPMAVQVAERLRQRLTELTDLSWPPQLAVSGSFGVSCWRPEATLHQCINEADEAMYWAKHAGRNRVIAGQGSGLEAPAGREGGPVVANA